MSTIVVTTNLRAKTEAGKSAMCTRDKNRKTADRGQDTNTQETNQTTRHRRAGWQLNGGRNTREQSEDDEINTAQV